MNVDACSGVHKSSALYYGRFMFTSLLRFRGMHKQQHLRLVSSPGAPRGQSVQRPADIAHRQEPRNWACASIHRTGGRTPTHHHTPWGWAIILAVS